jgi:hypothetical protein
MSVSASMISMTSSRLIAGSARRICRRQNTNPTLRPELRASKTAVLDGRACGLDASDSG